MRACNKMVKKQKTKAVKKIIKNVQNKNKSKQISKAVQKKSSIQSQVVEIKPQLLLPQLPPENAISDQNKTQMNKKSKILFIIFAVVVLLLLVFYILSTQKSAGDTAGQVIGVLASCIDSDGGDLPLAVGTVTIAGEGKTETYLDSCNGNFLTEYYCNNKNIEQTIYQCNNACDKSICN